MNRDCDVGRAVVDFVVDLGLKLECDACRELNAIRAMILVNFGKDARANRYGFFVEDEGSTHDMAFRALDVLANRPGSIDPEATECNGIKYGDTVEMTDGTITTCKGFTGKMTAHGFIGQLMIHTGGFSELSKIRGKV